MRAFRILLITILLAGTALLRPISASAIDSSVIITLTNQQRQMAGLRPLRVNKDLMASAEAKAKDMIKHDYWAHYSPNGTSPWRFISLSGYKFQAAGENLAMDYSDDHAVIEAWMNSPEHRANLLNPKFQDIGVAVVNGQLQGHPAVLVVAHYGLPARSLSLKNIQYIRASITIMPPPIYHHLWLE